MRKDALLTLIAQYDHSKKWLEKKLYHEHSIIASLKRFLDSKKYMSGDTEISWNDFKNYLFVNKQLESLIIFEENNKNPNKFAAEVEVLNKFKDSVKYSTQQTADIFQLPDDLLKQVLPNFLSMADASRFFRTAKSLYIKSNINEVWIKRIKDLGIIDNKALKTVIDSDVINNYKSLYRVLSLTVSNDSIKHPWQLLCLSGETKAFDIAIKEFGLTKNTMDDNGRGLVHYAAWSGKPEQLDKAISLGCNLNQKDNEGHTVVHYAARSGSPAQLDKIKKLGLNLNQKNKYGRTAVHHAAWSKSPEQLNKVKELGLDLNQKDDDGRTAVHYAAWSESPAQLDQVKKFGLDLNQKDNYGCTAVHYAARSGSPAQLDKIKKLGLNLNQKNKGGRTAVHYAGLSGIPEQLDMAKTLGLDLNQKDKDGCTALHYAARSGKPEQLDRAIALGFNPKQTDLYGRNAINFAAWSGSPKQVVKVVELGLNPERVDTDGNDVIHYAKLSENPDTVEKVKQLIAQKHQNATWIIRIKALKLIDNNTLSIVIESGAISNYESLYQVLSLGILKASSIKHPWQLLCLSGETKAFDRATKEFGLTKDTVDDEGRSPAHFAAMSESLAQIDKAKELGIDLEQADKYGKSVIDYAKANKNPDTVKKVEQLITEKHQAANTPKLTK